MQILYKIWQIYNNVINTLLLKKHYNHYKILPFGCYCLPRVITQHNKLKPSKKHGEETFPFDLCFSEFNSNIKLLCDNFKDFYKDFKYDNYIKNHKCWGNKSINMICNHDLESSFDNFKQRYNNRIKNLYTILHNKEKYLFIIIATFVFIEKTQIDLLIRELIKYRSVNTFSIIIINQSEKQFLYNHSNIFYIDLSKDKYFKKMNKSGDWVKELKYTKSFNAMIFNQKINNSLLKIIKSKRHLWTTI